MSEPFVAAPKNIGNAYRNSINGNTYVMVSAGYNKYAIVSLFHNDKWQGPIESGREFRDKIGHETELEYIGQLDTVRIKREITQIEKVTK